MIIDLRTGASAYAPGTETITDDTFGVRFATYTDLGGFLDQINDLNVGLIVWPGGTLAETRTDRFGLEYDGLYSDGFNQVGLDRMMAVAIEKGATLSVVLPTLRYDGKLNELQEDLDIFLGDLLGGAYGALPDTLILEIGNEYFAHFGTGAANAADYANVADVMIREIALALADPTINTIGADLSIAVQSGKTFSEDAAIRDTLSDFALSNVDMITHHRFPWQPQGFDSRIDTVDRIVDAWERDADAIGSDRPELFVSAYNTAAYTRKEALGDFLDENPGLSATDVDLDGRTTTEFERFWQSQLDQFAYGGDHARAVLEAYASYAEAGMDAAAIFGTDFPHAGRLSYETKNGVDHQFVAGDMLEMIYESVEGTRVLESGSDFDPSDRLTTYAFENDDKLVVFLAGGKAAPGDVTLDIDGLGSDYLSVWAESLRAETPSNWMNEFDVPDNLAVDEAPEAETYAKGVRTALDPEVAPEGIKLNIAAGEVVRLAFAKSEDGADEIDGWSQGAETDLAGIAWQEEIILDNGAIDAEEDPDLAALAEVAASGGGAAAAVLLLPLLLLA